MIDRKEKNYVTCPVCGKPLMKVSGTVELEIKCGKCDRDIVAHIDQGRVMVFENRRMLGDKQYGASRESIRKEGSTKIQKDKRICNC